MKVTVEIPDVLSEALPSGELEVEMLESLLLKRMSEGRISTGQAARLLDKSILETIQWYTRHGLPYPNLSPDEAGDEVAAGRNLQL